MSKRLLSQFLFLAIVVTCGSGVLADTPLRVCFWNVESGGASSNVNAGRIKDEQGVDIWGLSEVKNASDATKYQLAAEDGESADFTSILGTTGGQDRLQIVFNSDKLELVENSELHDLNIGGSVRAPLVAKFKIVGTDQEFLFVVNHLYRSNNSARHTQAKKLNNWAESQDKPTIIGGDMNFDWHYQSGATNHDAGYDFLVEDGVCHWVQPSTLVPTNSSSHRSVLDFIFVSGTAMTWPATSTILVKAGDFPDGTSRSDHRPVDCVFTIPEQTVTPLSPQVFTRAEAIASQASRLRPQGARPSGGADKATLILERIEKMRLELEELQGMVEAMNSDPD